MSLIEATKESTIKNILEINNVVRMSLIEMQFIKKEMMNALYAMDELMGSNEINMRLAAMTPAFLIASSIRYVFRKLFYALLKVGKSKEQTYASFRHILLDIERLLVMRDDPPRLPPPLTATGANHHGRGSCGGQGRVDEGTLTLTPLYNDALSSACILKSDDLGMLML